MRTRHLLKLTLVLTVIGALAPAAYVGVTPAGAAGPSLVIDAGISGNQAAAPGPIVENCIAVKKDTVFQMDIVIRDIKDLLAWELYLDYDKNVVIVTGQDTKLFQQANAGSSVLDVSKPVPDDSGFHKISAFDSSDPETPDSGSGVLARVTFKAVGSGDSKINFGTRDLDQDGKLDIGTLLKGIDGNPIGDVNGDKLFDGPQTGAEVAVDQNCPVGTIVAPAPSGQAPGDVSTFPWPIAGGAAAVIVVVLGAGGLLLLSRRRRAVRAAAPNDAS